MAVGIPFSHQSLCLVDDAFLVYALAREACLLKTAAGEVLLLGEAEVGWELKAACERGEAGLLGMLLLLWRWWLGLLGAEEGCACLIWVLLLSRPTEER